MKKTQLEVVKDFSNKMIGLTHKFEQIRFKNKNIQLLKKQQEISVLEKDIQQLLASQQENQSSTLSKSQMDTLKDCQKSVLSINGLRRKCQQLQKRIEEEKNSNNQIEMSIKFMQQFLLQQQQAPKTLTLPRIQSAKNNICMNQQISSLQSSLRQQIQKTQKISYLLENTIQSPILNVFQQKISQARKQYEALKIRMQKW